MTPTAVSPIEETLILNGIPAHEIRAQLDVILRSRAFIQSHRIRRFLQFVVEESLLGQPQRLKEYLIGVEFYADHFHIILQLRQCADRSYIWSEAADGQFSDLSSVEQLAHSLVRDLSASHSDAPIGRRHSGGQESRDYYLQGRYYWKLATPDSIRNSVASFTKAVECDENY